MSQFAYVVLK